jgi:methionine biosynthesis protein MetW
MSGLRADLAIIAREVAKGARVLDVGCGDGALMAALRDDKQVDARGMEIDRDNVAACVARGLSVIQGNADTDLADYPDAAFDVVILSNTLQAMQRPADVLAQLVRIGRSAIVSFPNFGHWRIRWQLATKGRMPVTKNLSYSWYDTPNIHFCTIRDFVATTEEINAHIERAVALDSAGQPMRFSAPWWVWNMFGEQAVFVLERGR